MKGFKNKGLFARLIAPLMLAVMCGGCFCASVFSCNRGNAEAKEEVKTAEENKIYHIFFHSLILDEEKAFKSKKSEGYNYWMTTRSEFNAILVGLYKNDFVLVDIESLVSFTKDGRTVIHSASLPKGKKPLVISFDDVNYYEYMKNDGFASRLCVDALGRVYAAVKTGNSEIKDYEGDHIPILETFIQNHPDFSWNGGRGVLAVTGYEGLLGYRNPVEAKAVCDALKKKGYKFASHSYTHTQKFKDNSITVERLTEELDRWENDIGSVCGSTQIFISPFGMHLKENDRRFKLLLSRGYRIYCPVDSKMPTYYGAGFMIQGRMSLDGLTLLKYYNRVQTNLGLEASLITSSNRPPIN
ncbi:MAG: hypothetical protein LBN25_03480 [Christensenellaceae bacterium]|nr:hypothetical protein [Christensenellaceae bacterium]